MNLYLKHHLGLYVYGTIYIYIYIIYIIYKKLKYILTQTNSFCGTNHIGSLNRVAKGKLLFIL